MKRSYLLLTTALLLSGCNRESLSINWLDALKTWITGTVPQEYIDGDLSVTADQILQQNYVEKTLTGSYLSGRFAQSNFDWQTANDYFSDVLASDPKNLELQRRSMVLAMGAGDYKSALDYARSVVNAGEENSLPKLFLTMETFKAGDYEQVLTEVEKIPDDGISEFVKPLLRSWASAGLKRTDINGLNKNVVHFYHAILVADYLNDIPTLKNLAALDYSKLGLSDKSLTQIAEILERHGLGAQAKEILRNSSLKSEMEVVTPIKKIDTPVEGMSRGLFDMASVLYQDYPDSARLFAQMSLYLDPSENDARILMAHMAAQFKRYDEAIDILNQIDFSKNPEMTIKLNRQIAELMEKSGKTDQAIGILRDVVAKTKDVDAQIQIGDIYREQEKFDVSLEEYNKAFKMLNGNVTAQYWNLLYARGISNERMKNWEAAEKDLKSALALEPDHPYILNYLGYSWIDQGINLDEATRMIEKAVRLRPDDGYIIDSLGWAYYRQGKYPMATRALERAAELSPYDPTINDHLGDAYWQVNRQNEARFQWRRALSFKPDKELAPKLELKIENGLTDIAPAPASGKAAQSGVQIFNRN